MQCASGDSRSDKASGRVLPRLFLNILCIEFFPCSCTRPIGRLVSSYRKRFPFKGEIFFLSCGKPRLMWGKLLWRSSFKSKHHLDMAAMLIWEKRLIFGSTAATLLAFLFQIIAVGTTSWIHIQFRSAFVRNASGMDVYITGYSGGLWRSCEEGYTVDSSGKKDDCKYTMDSFIHSFWATHALAMVLKLQSWIIKDISQYPFIYCNFFFFKYTHLYIVIWDNVCKD